MPGTWSVYVIPREGVTSIDDVDQSHIVCFSRTYVDFHNDEFEIEIDDVLSIVNHAIQECLSKGIKPIKDSKDYHEYELYYMITGEKKLRAIKGNEIEFNNKIVPTLDEIGLEFPLYDVNLSKIVLDYAKSSLVCYVSLYLW